MFIVSLYFIPEPLPVPRPFGLSNNRINNRYITASSSVDRYHAPWLGRLHNKKRGRYSGGWSAKVNKQGQYLQVDLRRPKTIVKVVTQGRSDANQWVTKFYIKYSSDSFYWVPYKKFSRVKVRSCIMAFFYNNWETSRALIDLCFSAILNKRIYT